MRFFLIVSMITAAALAGWMVTRTEAATKATGNRTVNTYTVDPTDMIRSIVEMPI